MTEREELAILNNKLTEVMKMMAATIAKVDNLHGALAGNELIPEGLIREVNIQKKRLDEIEDSIDSIDKKFDDKFKAMKWTATGLVLGAGYGGIKLIQSIIHFFSEK